MINMGVKIIDVSYDGRAVLQASNIYSNSGTIIYYGVRNFIVYKDIDWALFVSHIYSIDYVQD